MLVGTAVPNDLMAAMATTRLRGGAGADIADRWPRQRYGSIIRPRVGGHGQSGSGTASGGDATGDTFSGIENIIGSASADTLTGDGNANTLSGGDGADSLSGGADTLTAATTIDALIGGAGAGLLNGGSGNDTADYPPRALRHRSISTARRRRAATRRATSQIERLVGRLLPISSGAVSVRTLSTAATATTRCAAARGQIR